MKFTLVSALFVAFAAVATPSFALNAVQAINECTTVPGCTSHVQNDGSVMIEGEGGWVIECTNMGSECFVLSEGGGGGGERLLNQAGPKKKSPRFIVGPSLLGASGGHDRGGSNDAASGASTAVPAGPMAPDP